MNLFFQNSTPEKSISLIDTTTPKHTPSNKSKDEADLLASLSITSPTNANGRHLSFYLCK